MNNLQNIIFRKLAIEGESLNNRIHDRHAPLIGHYNATNGNSYFAVVLGSALQWTHHATDGNDFLDYAIPWFDSNDPLDLNILDNFDGYLGIESLISGMTGLKIFKDAVNAILPDFEHCDAKDIVKCQQQALRHITRLIDNHQISGVGTWLFLGPFKIILTIENKHWADSNIDAIVLPTGREVVKGIMRLLNEFPQFCNFDRNWLNENEPGLRVGYATEQLIHTECIRIANIANSRAVHINSGLWLYGAREIDLP